METSNRFGNYQIVRKIGAGGMADVYEAVRLGLENFQTRVALKCILPSLTRDERFVKMFINEAHLGSQLQHPNIIQIQDFNKVNDTYYIAMEYVEGADLARIIKRMRARGLSFPVTVVLDLGLQALAGLGYAHLAKRADGTPLNIIHRDVKPSNFLLTPGGAAKIGDFGIAKAANSTTSHSLTGERLKGTIHYMSPEQVDGVPLSPASDLFSLGSILFEMLTLRPLFSGPTMSAILLKIVMVNIESDIQLTNSTYPEFEPVLRKALALDPGDRFADAAHMIETLHQVQRRYEDGLSLREFLAMHPELFAPFGTQPGDDDDDAHSLNVVRSPSSLADRPSMEPVVGYRDEAPPLDVELEPSDQEDEAVFVGDDAPAVEDPADAPPIAFDYYPPEPSIAESEPHLAPSDADLSDVARAVLASSEQDDDMPLNGFESGLLDDPVDLVGNGLGSSEGGEELVYSAPPAPPRYERLASARRTQTGDREDEDDSRLTADTSTTDGRDGTETGGLAARSVEGDVPAPDLEADPLEDPELKAEAWYGEPGGTAKAERPLAVSVEGIHRDMLYSSPSWGRRILLGLLAVLGGAIVAVLLFFMALAPDASRPDKSDETSETAGAGADGHAIPVEPPPVRAAQLTVASTPPGARIYFAGEARPVALTPTVLPLPLDISNITVRLELEGYQTFLREISYVAGQELSLNPTLVPLETRGSIKLVSKPPGARIMLNGVDTNHRTPDTLTGLDVASRHIVTLRMIGYRNWKKELEAAAGETREVTANLVPVRRSKRSTSPSGPSEAPVVSDVPEKALAKTAKLVLSTWPINGQVYVDGKLEGKVTRNVEVSPGTHLVEFETFEGTRKSTQVTVEPNEQRKVVWDIKNDRWLSR